MVSRFLPNGYKILHPNFYRPIYELWRKKHYVLKRKLLHFILFHHLANLGTEFVEHTCADTQQSGLTQTR